VGSKNAISDEKLVTLREQLYCFAELALDLRDSGRNFVTPNSAFEQIASSQEDLNALRERAAIIEFDGNVSRDEAERMAISLSLATERVN
jgi:hypothetical protein